MGGEHWPGVRLQTAGVSMLAIYPLRAETALRPVPSSGGDQPSAPLLANARWRLLVAAVLLMPFAASAQVSTNMERAPTLTIERYSEDWSWLADPANRKGDWAEPLKYIPLNDDGATYLTTGLEARSRYEAYENVNWGSSPNDGYVWNRLMPHADLHVGKVRLFAMPILSAISGTDRPKRPADTTGVDMLQAFVEVDLAASGGDSLRLSAGRKLVSLGSGRFIDRRYGTGVPLPFDGFEAILTGKTRRVTAFYLQPVDTRRGEFNDRRSRDKAVWGVYATRWLDAKHLNGFDVYYIGLRDRNAVFDQDTVGNWRTPSVRGSSATTGPGIGTSRPRISVALSPAIDRRRGARGSRRDIASGTHPCDPRSPSRPTSYPATVTRTIRSWER